MDDRIYGSELIAHFATDSEGSGELVIETGRVSAAGELLVHLMDGLVLRVDFARPETLIGIDVEITGPTDADRYWKIPSRMIPMLRSLIGTGAVKEVQRLVGGGENREMEIAGPRRRDEQDPWLRDQAAALGEAVHLLDIANDPEELLGVRVVAAFESVRYSAKIWHDRIENEINRLAIEAIERIRLADSQDDSGLS
ncbi:MAG: hypothetical protein ACKOYO_04040, partial [Actinomycetota bacterium]